MENTVNTTSALQGVSPHEIQRMKLAVRKLMSGEHTKLIGVSTSSMLAFVWLASMNGATLCCTPARFSNGTVATWVLRLGTV